MHLLYSRFYASKIHFLKPLWNSVWAKASWVSAKPLSTKNLSCWCQKNPPIGPKKDHLYRATCEKLLVSKLESGMRIMMELEKIHVPRVYTAR